MKWYYYVGIGLLGAGIAVSHFYEGVTGLVIFAGGVILTTLGVKEKVKKEVTTKV